ncbi:MAG: type II and III secretion system protein [Flavobacteriales bacterium]|jgi:type IV pilus assembly protein PilQ|nr:type II and III secretion system protein [Flavobacteriales bacterium]
MKRLKYILLILFAYSSIQLGYAQKTDRIKTIETSLTSYSKTYTKLNNEVDLSVSNSSLKEFIRGIALANELNVTIAPDITNTITNNFSKAKVLDVFVYLCQEYDLELDIIGSIISFKKYVKPLPVEKPYVRKNPDISYKISNDFLSLKLKNDTLDYVVEYITDVSGKNVIMSPKVKGKIVSVFIKNRPFEEALDKMALSNGLKISKTTDNFYFVELATLEEVAQNNHRNTNRRNTNNSANNPKNKTNNLLVEFKDSLVTVEANNVEIQKIIEEVSVQLKENYFLYDTPKGTANLYLENATYGEFLSYLLSGSDYTFKQDQEVYLIGNRNSESLRQTKLIELENRRIENVLDAIPAKLKEGIEISEFIELNGLIVSGSAIDLRELEEFIEIIDVIVPVITIDVIIADVSDSKTLSTGIQAGLGENPNGPTSGTVSPGVDLNLSTDAINDVVEGVNGLGILNLGNVAPNFYLSLKALEEDGIVKIKSTPTVATLNGHETSMKIGDQQYYLEVNNQIVNNQISPNVYQSQQWKSVTADLSITVTPSVSKDEQVTLDIKVEQSTFTTKVAETAPPGQTTRSFESLVRVRNGETILLGGLDENQKTATSSGIPFISRIPVLRSIFGSRSKKKLKKQLTIFIKPTISYE